MFEIPSMCGITKKEEVEEEGEGAVGEGAEKLLWMRDFILLVTVAKINSDG